MSDHVKKRHNVNCILYHLVCPAKYRRKVFTEAVEATLKTVCCNVIEYGFEMHFVEIGSDEDHVHFLIQSVPAMLPSRLVQIVKSITARQIFARHPEVKKMLWGGSFWTSGYYLNTVSLHGNEETIRRYVAEQGNQYKLIHRGQLTLFEGLA